MKKKKIALETIGRLSYMLLGAALAIFIIFN